MKNFTSQNNVALAEFSDELAQPKVYKNGLKKVLGIWFDLVLKGLKVKYSTILIFKVSFLLQNSTESLSSTCCEGRVENKTCALTRVIFCAPSQMKEQKDKMRGVFSNKVIYENSTVLNRFFILKQIKILIYFVGV